MTCDERYPLLPLILHRVPWAVREVLAQEGVPFRWYTPGLPEGRFVLLDSRRVRRPAIVPGQVALDVAQLRNGPHDPLAELQDERSARQRWRIGGITVSEEVARVDRRAVRQRLVRRLRGLIERAGGIWLAVSPFPFPYRTALNFRIDYDQYDAADFKATLGAIAGREEATSHFVNAAAYLRHENALAQLRGLDVGSHGYRHHTYRSVEENLANIRRGIETLRTFGIEPSGFAAPHGRFYRPLLFALEILGIGHSSEFGLAYDELPFVPRGSHVLQIPVHPICLGLFLEAVDGQAARRRSATRHLVRLACEHFLATMQGKYRAGEPLFFYGHPTGRLGRHPELLHTVLETGSALSLVWKTTLSGFAAWWRARAQTQLRVVRRGEKYLVLLDRQPSGYQLAVDYWRGTHVARMPLAGRSLMFAPASLVYERRVACPAAPPVRANRPEGLRSRIRRWIDWERETPLEEIPRGDWRHWAKRTLRRFSL